MGAEESFRTFHNHPGRDWMGRRETLGGSMSSAYSGVKEGHTEWVWGLARGYVHIKPWAGIGVSW